MVDNCSTTARLGTRKWGPRFEHVVRLEALPSVIGITTHPEDLGNVILEAFRNHPVHQALEVCATMRPSVDISVVG